MLDRQRRDSEENATRLPLSDDASFLLARANALSLTATNDTLAPLGLKARSYSVLALAAGEDRLSQRDLAAYLRLDPSQVVALVDELQQRGLVDRRANPKDRRTNVVVATEQGTTLAAQAHEILRVAEDTLLESLSKQERAAFAALLQKIAFPPHPSR